MKKVRFGRIHADHVTFSGALDEIRRLVTLGTGGYVVTPNVDHVCLAEQDEALRRAYAVSSLAVVDGMPLVWLARALGHPLPEKISGSDLILPLMQCAATQRWRVYFLGAAPGVGQRAADILAADYPGMVVAGVEAPPLGFDHDKAASQRVVDRVVAARPHLILVALGCPKQEMWCYRHAAAVAPAVSLCIGASLDFIAGASTRSPTWMSQVGLEWVYRLAKEPRRLAKRYLVRDRAILGVAWRMWRTPNRERVVLA